MTLPYADTQILHQLEPRKGGYYYLTVPAAVVQNLPHKRETRLICTLEDKITFQCGLNHLGDGNFFIIISTKNVKTIGKKNGDALTFFLQEDPNPLGVDMPEVLEVLLEQDENLKNQFEKLSMGKKRAVIHTVKRIKDLDKQVETAMRVIVEAGIGRKKL